MKILKKLVLISFFFILLIGNFTSVFGVEDIQIKITPNTKELTTSDIILIIDVSSSKVFDSNSTQGVEILLGEISESNKWIELGSGKNGVALKKSYNYIVKENANITVRVISWTKEDKTDLTEIASQKIEINNIDKKNPVIEKIDVTSKNDSISLNIIAKDDESAIVKYTCLCNEINYNKTKENSKFEISGLEVNKEYDFKIEVEDKMGNKASINKKVQVKPQKDNVNSNTQIASGNVTSENSANQTENTVIEDNTVANKILPAVGAQNIMVAMGVVLFISSLYIISRK